LAQKLLNLWSEDGANIIDDDTTAVLTLENTSTGAALLATNTAGTGPALVAQSLIGTATVAPLVVQTSTVSGAAIEFRGKAIVSATSGGSILGAFRVKFGDRYGWVPVMVHIAGQGA
jgi:hypothetical protein